MGRPSLIDAPVVQQLPDGSETETTVSEAIVQALRAGAFIEDACEAVGIAKQTVYNWIARGQEHADPGVFTKGKRKGEPRPVPSEHRVYVDFMDAVTRARAQGRLWHIANLRRHAADDWRASAFYLERTQPKKWAKRVELDVDPVDNREPAEIDAALASATERAFRDAAVPGGVIDDVLPELPA